jgi:hypothetical protein
MDSIFMNYFYLSETTKLLFLFRRLNTCNHKFSCLESILRKLYGTVSAYATLRIPLHYLLTKFGYEKLTSSKTLIAVELSCLLVFALIRAAGGCFVRYLHEEVIKPLPLTNMKDK